jgi:hypothetical protein
MMEVWKDGAVELEVGGAAPAGLEGGGIKGQKYIFRLLGRNSEETDLTAFFRSFDQI